MFITKDLTRIRDRIGKIEQSDHQTPDHVAIRMEHGEVIGRDLTHKNCYLCLGLWPFMIDWSVRLTPTNASDQTVNHQWTMSMTIDTRE